MPTLVMRLQGLPTDLGVPVWGAVQIRRDVEQITPLDRDDMELRAEFAVVETDGGLDFRGPYVQGRRGERFVYISWGLGDDPDAFHMFRRAKVMLGQIPPALLGGETIVATIAGTSSDGGPVCGRVLPAEVEWRAG